MTTNIIAPERLDVKTIKVFNKRDDWWIEVNFVGGAKCITQATTDEVTAIEHDLREQGWQVDASVFHRGFNAKPAPKGCEALIEVEEFIFSMPELWPDDLALEMVRL